MSLEIITPGEYSSFITSDLANRRGTLLSINQRKDVKV